MKRRSGFGWLEGIIGALLIALGVCTCIQPQLVLTGMAALYGVAAIIMGVADILLYIRAERFTGFGPILSLASGILSVMAGIMLLAYPAAGVLVLSVLFPIWFIAHCIARLCHLPSIRLIGGEGIYFFVLVLNIIGLLLGFLMLLRPGLALSTLGYLAGIYLILLGVDSLVLAFSNMGRRR